MLTIRRLQSLTTNYLQCLQFTFPRFNSTYLQYFKLPLFGSLNYMVSDSIATRSWTTQNISGLTKIDIFVALQHVNFGTDVVKLNEVLKTYIFELG